MTREEAKEALSVLKIYDNQWLREAIDMAIEALQFADKSPRTVKLTEDIEITLVEEAEEAYEIGYTHGQMADRPKGLWTITTTDDGEGGGVPHLICSVCGNEPTAWSSRQFFNFCPNCGADMRGDKE